MDGGVRDGVGFAILGSCLAALVVGVVYLWPFAIGDVSTPYGYDTMHYLWRARVVEHGGLDALESIPAIARPNLSRPAYPVVASAISAVGPGPTLLAYVLPAVLALAIGLAAAGFAVEMLREPRWTVPLYVVLVATSLLVVRTASGSLDNLVVDALALAGATAVLLASDGRRTLGAGILLFAAAFTFHWIFTALLGAVLVVVALILLTPSLDRRRTGEHVLRTPSGRILFALALALAIAVVLLPGGAWSGRMLPNVDLDAIEAKVAGRIPKLRLWLAVPFASLGFLSLWRRRSPLARLGLVFLVSWCAVAGVATAAYYVLGWRSLPLYRILDFTLAIPLLATAGMVTVAIWAVRRFRSTGGSRVPAAEPLSARAGLAGAAVLVVAIGVSVGLGAALWISARPWDPDVVREAATAGRYVRAADRSERPVIVVSDGRRYDASDRIVRASVPGDLVPRIRIYPGTVPDLLAGRPLRRGWLSDDSRMAWPSVRAALDEDPIVLHLSSLNAAPPPSSAAPVGPGVHVVRGPASPVMAARAAGPGPATLELAMAAAAFFAILVVVGLGWSVALLDASWTTRTVLSPCFGIAALALAGLAAARVGVGTSGAMGTAIVVTTAALGWAPVAARRAWTSFALRSGETR